MPHEIAGFGRDSYIVIAACFAMMKKPIVKKRVETKPEVMDQKKLAEVKGGGGKLNDGGVTASDDWEARV
jgi:hypothetical protein